jgi:hypothetical protein
VPDNMQGELSAHAVAVSKLNGKKIARTVKCFRHDSKSIGIIDMPDAARWGHFALPSFDTGPPEEGIFALK